MAAQNATTCEGFLNFTDDEEGAYLAQYNPLETVFITIVIPIFSFVGLIGNLGFLFTIARVERLRSATINYYLVTLAITDAFSTLGFFMFFIWPYLDSVVSYDVPYTCWFTYGMLFTSVQVSVGLVTVVAIERYLAICRPHIYHRIASKRRAVQIIVAVFVVAIVAGGLSTPHFGKNVTLCVTWPDTPTYEDFPAVIRQCQKAKFTFPFSLVIFNDLIIYADLVLSIVLYWKIVKGLRTQAEKVKSRGLITEEIRNQIARMLIVNGCVFFICQIPARILNMGLGIGEATNTAWITPGGEEKFILILEAALLLNAAANPYIYGLLSSHYREAAREAFGFSCSSSSTSSSQSSGNVKDSSEAKMMKNSQPIISQSTPVMLRYQMTTSEKS